MSANVVQLERLFRRSWDWSANELAEFYRVEAVLIQAGLRIDTERGVSDEGDPWFAFCRSDNGEVIVHIARIGGLYILASPSYDGVASGRDIASLVRDLVSRHPLIQMRGDGRGQSSKVFLHPAALLIAVVTTAFFKSTDARALTDDQRSSEGRGGSGGGGAAPRPEPVTAFESHKTVMLDAAQSAVILSAVAAVLQGTSAHANEQGIQPSTAPTSDLLDFASLPPATHSPSPALLLAGGEAQGLQSHDHAAAQPMSLHNTQYLLAADAKIEDRMVASAIAHPAAVDSLPLVAVLWDLPAHRPVTKSISDEGSLPSAAPTSSAAASSAAPASPTSHAAVPILTVKLVANNEADDSLPVVQATKITYPSSQGTVDTHTQLANALSNALKESAHATIDAGSLGLPGGSAANALASSLTDHSNGSSDNASTTSSSKTIPTAGTTSIDKATATNKAPADKAPAATDKVPTATDKAPTSTDKTTPPTDPSSAQHSQDVTLFVRDFLAHINDWSLIQNDKSVIIYDAAAVSTDPGHLQSFTIDFSDGSTLSLVGLPAAFPHGLFAA